MKKHLLTIAALALAMAVSGAALAQGRGGGGGGGSHGGGSGGGGWSGGGSGGGNWGGGSGGGWHGGSGGGSWGGGSGGSWNGGGWHGGSGNWNGGWHGGSWNGGWNNGWRGGSWNGGWNNGWRGGWVGWGAPAWGWGWGCGAWCAAGWWPGVGLTVGWPGAWGWGTTFVDVAPASGFVTNDTGVWMSQESPTPNFAPQAVPAAPAANNFWFYCVDPAGYFPYVQTCNRSWMTVIPPSNPGSPLAPRLAQ